MIDRRKRRRRMWEEVDSFPSFDEAKVYLYYDGEGKLLRVDASYAPVVDDVPERHREAYWWPLVDHKRTIVTGCSRVQARQLLIRTIRTEPLVFTTPPDTSRPCALYRHYDANGVLLYIGITYQQSLRDAGHRAMSAWVALAHRSESQWFPARADALAAEVTAIQVEVPIFNREHVLDGRERRVLDYLEEAGRLDLALELL